MRIWLAQRPRYHVHYTPTYSSWLNKVERWFWPDHPGGDSPRVLHQCQGFDRKDRLICPALQPLASTLRLDRYREFILERSLDFVHLFPGHNTREVITLSGGLALFVLAFTQIGLDHAMAT